MRKLKRPTVAENRRIEEAIANDPDTWVGPLEKFAQARRGRPVLPEEMRKLRVTIMLDRDVVEKFRAGGRGWQTRMNAALRKAAR